ncbi:hypothetical protein COU61_00440 [Candidatus Pacearchaeota archaeon CG10_big_fil_rev_8_21_14_0_10_35_13]|nr:MAG: hypothetical protein COU61_00440 [Candidatus Pacearchaeota archaeon CG10_big_fil_rev_8_21_14_0_10_35_13]
MSKRGQVTIFIVVGIVIIVVISMFVVFKGKNEGISSSGVSTENPQYFISKCVEEATNEAIEKILPQGGVISTEGRVTKEYLGKKIVYSCYNQGFYEQCTNQNPAMINSVVEEITNYVRPITDNCFVNLKNDYEKKGAIIDVGNSNEMIIKTEITKGKITINIKRKITISDKGTTTSYEEYKTSINSPLYELLKTAIIITNQESLFCHAEYLGMMINNPEIIISRTEIGGVEEIYGIKDRSTEEELMIAIKGCSIPTGI